MTLPINGGIGIQEGDSVMVAYPPGEKTLNPAHRLDGEQFVVKRKYRVGGGTKSGDRYVYELYGASSDKGVPYAFLTDELIKL